MTAFELTAYGPIIASVLEKSRLMPLGPGNPNAKVQTQLKALTLEQAFGHVNVRDQDMAKCCLAALWLYRYSPTALPEDGMRAGFEAAAPGNP